VHGRLACPCPLELPVFPADVFPGCWAQVEADSGLVNFLLARSAAAMKTLETEATVKAKALRDSNKVHTHVP
jgi:hypothetical protein